MPTLGVSKVVSGLADTGAQMCVADVSLATKLGVRECEYVYPALQISAANNAGLEIAGGMFMTMTTTAGTRSRQMVYLARGVGEFYLSQEACQDLGVIPREFPQPQPAESASPPNCHYYWE